MNFMRKFSVTAYPIKCRSRQLYCLFPSPVLAQKPGSEEHAGEPVFTTEQIDVPEFAQPDCSLSRGRRIADSDLVEKRARLDLAPAVTPQAASHSCCTSVPEEVAVFKLFFS